MPISTHLQFFQTFLSPPPWVPKWNPLLGRAESIIASQLPVFLLTDPPKIQTKLAKEVHLNEGESYTLECEATGKPKPMVIWMKGNTRIKEKRNKAQVILNPVKYVDKGPYKCMAVNRGGVVEVTVNLTVSCEYNHLKELSHP